MTDQQTYTDDTWQTDLTIKCMQDATVIMVGSTEADDDRLVMLPTLALLTMIDRAAPDMMRAYLRETAPEVIADLYRPEIPEAGSPEDVDEHPEPVIAVTPEALDAAEQLGRYVAEIRDAFARGIAR